MNTKKCYCPKSFIGRDRSYEAYGFYKVPTDSADSESKYLIPISGDLTEVKENYVRKTLEEYKAKLAKLGPDSPGDYRNQWIEAKTNTPVLLKILVA